MAKTLHSRHNKIFLDKLRKLRQSRSLRQADLALLLGRTQNRVSNVERGQTRLDIIELREWLDALNCGFAPEPVTGNLNSFGDRLRWDAEAPEVSGWVYSLDGTPAALSTMQHEQLMLMVAMASPRNRQVRECEQLVESWWRDIDRLEAVIQVCGQMRRDVLIEAFAANEESIGALRRFSLQDGAATPPFRAARVAVALALRRLQRSARRTRRVTLGAHAVDPAKVEAVRNGVSLAALAAPKLPGLIERLTFVPRLESQTLSLSINEPKKLYQAWLGHGVDSHDLKRWGDQVLAHSCAWAVNRRILDEAITPVGDASWRNNFDPAHEEMQELIARIVERSRLLLAAGIEPVILTGHSGSGAALARVCTLPNASAMPVFHVSRWWGKS